MYDKMLYAIAGCVTAAALIAVVRVLRTRRAAGPPLPVDELMDIVPDSVIVLDGGGRVLDQNEAAKHLIGAMTGRPARQLLGTLLTEQLPAFEPLLDEFRRQGRASAELTIGIGDRRRTLTAAVKPVSTGAVLTVRDITELRRLEREWRVKAMTDGLTGISNRTGFMERMADLWKGSASGEPLSLLLMDIDHFKSINDRFGHQTGDEVIRAFVGTVLGVVSMPYVFGRVGGEEFALALPGRTRRQAIEAAERIRQSFEQTCLKADDGREVRSTVSIGIACRTAEEGNFNELFAKADRSLYRAKQNGRNQTQIT